MKCRSFLISLSILASVLVSCQTKIKNAEDEEHEKKEQPVTIVPKVDSMIKEKKVYKKLVISKGSTIQIKSANTLLKQDAKEDEIFEKCKTWDLQSALIADIIKNGSPISMHDFSYLYYVLPCEVNGMVEIDSVTYKYKVNAGSFFTISNPDTTYYFGCRQTRFKKYFLMEGGVTMKDDE